MAIQLNVNGRSYDAIDVQVLMLGSKASVSAISYGFERDHENRYVLGSDEPKTFSMGPKKYTDGSLSMYMEEMVSIEDAGGGDITKVKPFKCIVTYLNDANRIVIDEITWKFKNWGREVDADSLASAKQYDMHTLSIKPNIPQ